MSRALDRGPAHDVPFGTVAIAPAGKVRRREGDEIRPVAVRIAHVSGGASYGRRGDPDGWEPASIDLSVATGDRVYAARGARLDLHTAAFEIHLASGAGLEAIRLTEQVNRFYVWGGSARFLVRELQPNAAFGVDTPKAAVTFERAGKYRVDVDSEGNTDVVVERGSAWVAASGVAVALGTGDAVRIDGIHCPAPDSPTLRPRVSGESGGETLPCGAQDQVLHFRPRQSH